MNEIGRRRCVVCDREYNPDLQRGKFAMIYCSGRCAFSSAPRSTESMERERKALSALLDEQAS